MVTKQINIQCDIINTYVLYVLVKFMRIFSYVYARGLPAFEYDKKLSFYLLTLIWKNNK